MNSPLLPRDSTEMIVVHGSFTTADEDLTVGDLERSDRISGRISCGHHYVITRHGDTIPARPPHLICGACGVFNDVSVSVCLIGGRSETGHWVDNYTDAQWDALQRLLKVLRREYPDADVYRWGEVTPVRQGSPGF